MSSASKLSYTRDVIYAVCTLIQTFLAIFSVYYISFWLEKKRREDDQRREDERTRETNRRNDTRREQDRRENERQRERQREEDRQKSDAEEIAAILTEEYDEVEQIFHSFKVTVDKLKANKVGSFTEFDVLLYMCHPDNWGKFSDSTSSAGAYQLNNEQNFRVRAKEPRMHKPYESFNFPNPTSQTPEMKTSVQATTDARQNVMSAVNKMMKFFLKFRFKLFSIMQNKECPDDIKLEFSSEIIEMGKTIYPFVWKHRQVVIQRVLKYFSNIPDHAIPQGPLLSARNQPSNGEPEEGSEGIAHSTTYTTSKTSPNLGSSNANQLSSEGNQGSQLKPYPGNLAVERAIPYIKCFRYKDDKMSCVLRCNLSAINTLAIYVELGKIDEKTSNDILGKIKKFLPDAGDNLLHSVRMVMFVLLQDSNFHKNRLVLNFADYAKSLVNSPSKANKKVVNENCERSLEKIEAFIRDLRHGDARVQVLLESTDTQKFLKDLAETMRQFIKRRTEEDTTNEENNSTSYSSNGCRESENGSTTSSSDESDLKKKQQLLSSLAEKRNLRICDVPGDGNCFFHAVAHRLNAAGKESTNGQEIRERLIVFFEAANPDVYMKFLKLPSSSQGQDATSNNDLQKQQRQVFKSYIDDLKKGAWADNLAVQGVADMLNINIEVITTITPDYAHKICPKQRSDRTITIGQIGEIHYVALENISDVDETRKTEDEED